MSASSPDLAERRFFESTVDEDGRPGFDAPSMPCGTAVGADAATAVAPWTTWSDALARRTRTPRRQLADMASREMARGTPFNFVPVLLAIGAFAYFKAGAEPPLYLLLSGCVLAAVAAFLARRRTGLHLPVLAILLVLVGGTLAKLETLNAATKMLGSEITTRLTGRIIAVDHLANGRVRLTLDVVSTERPQLRYAPDRVRVTARTIPEQVRAGDEVIGAVRLLPPLGATRPGGYDFAFESYFDGIGATGFFLGEPKRVEIPGTLDFAGRFNAAVENARDRLAARIRSQIGGAEGEIAAALIAGVRAGIPEDINEALRRTGLAHVLSISGLHMALVAATIVGALRFLLACFPRFASRHPVRKYAASAALVALAIYLFISGNQVAAQRSFIMIAIMLIALLFDHAALTMRNLALAAIIVLALSPHEVMGPSFQMSFAATIALIGAYAGWSPGRAQRTGVSRPQRPAWRIVRLLLLYVLGLAATSLLAGTATAIFGAHHFQRVSPLSLFANLAAMPIVSVLVMPFAVLGLVLMPIGLDGSAFAVMGEGLRLMNAVAIWFSDRSPLDAVGLIAPGAVICMTLALLFSTLFTTRLRLIAVPFVFAGIVLLSFPPRPAVFISDDGRLVALRTSSGAIAINRSRANAFTLEGWMRAFPTVQVFKPLKAENATLDVAIASLAQAGGSDTQPDDERFHCSADTCLAILPNGAFVVTNSSDVADAACGKARLLLIDDATLENNCEDPDTLVITRKDLARRGSVMIDAGMRAVFAAREPYRPWHSHRQFSREARGMAAWQPDRSKAKKPSESENGAADGHAVEAAGSDRQR